MKPPSTPKFPALNNANQSKRSCKKHVEETIHLRTVPVTKNCSPSQLFDIVSKNSFCSNCLSNKHEKQNCPSTKRCQTCGGYQHKHCMILVKIIKHPPAAFVTTNSTGTNVINQENQPVKQQSGQGNNSNASVSSKSQKNRYGQSFAIRIKLCALICTIVTKMLAWIICSLHQKKWFEKLSQYLF